MKKFIIIGGIFLVLILGIVVAIPFMVPLEKYKDVITAKVKETTGRDVKVAGKISFTLFPNIAVVLRDVEFSNFPEGNAKTMFSAKEVHAGLKLVPLLSQKIEVEKFILDTPVINLEKNKEGKANWEFGAAEKPAEKKPEAKEKSGFDLSSLKVGVVKIINGDINYYSGPKVKPTSVKSLNFEVKTSSLDKPIKIIADGVFEAKKFKVDLEGPSFNEFNKDKAGSLKLAAEYAAAKIDYAGKVNLKDGIAADGEVKFDTKNLKEVTGSDAVGLLNFSSKVNLKSANEKNEINLKEIKLVADDIIGDGSLKVITGGGLTSIVGNLSVDKLDLNKFSKTDGAAQTEKAPAGEFKWSDDKIDLSALKKINAQIELKAKELVIKKASIKPVIANINMAGGKLSVVMNELKLYGGSANARIDVNASGSVPTFAKNINVANVRTDEFLRDFSAFDRLSGKGNLKLNVSGSGSTQREIVSNLNGTSEFKVTDGSIKGIDLVGMVRNVQSAFITGAETKEKKTDFSELSGTFPISSGIINNKDLTMKAPLIRLAGSGTVDLPRLQVNYRVNPEIVPTLEGQGASEKVAGLKVPVLISGSLLKPKFGPDLKGMLENELKDPGALRDNIKAFKKDGKSMLDGLLGKPKKSPVEAAPAAAPVPAEPAPQLNKLEKQEAPAAVQTEPTPVEAVKTEAPQVAPVVEQAPSAPVEAIVQEAPSVAPVVVPEAPPAEAVPAGQ